jgi:hypothetical protein
MRFLHGIRYVDQTNIVTPCDDVITTTPLTITNINNPRLSISITKKYFIVKGIKFE